MVNAGSLEDRARGVLVGLAVGDALGAPVEFESPARIAGRRAELREMPGGGSFGWAPGEFTDDTQMALVLARHLNAHRGSIDQTALAGEFASWASQAADVGTQTRQVLDAVGRGIHWTAAVSRLKPNDAGNGSLMRVAPVSLPASSGDDAATLARLQSEVTHPNEDCRDACAVFRACSGPRSRRAVNLGSTKLSRGRRRQVCRPPCEPQRSLLRRRCPVG